MMLMHVYGTLNILFRPLNFTFADPLIAFILQLALEDV